MSLQSHELSRRSDRPTPLTRRGLLAFAVAVVLSGLVYVNALDNPFVYDDRRLVVENRSLQSPFDLRAIFLHEATRPIVNLSYAIDRALWGPRPFGFHLTNVILHMLNVGLLFQLAWRVADDRRLQIKAAATSVARPRLLAFIAAVLFAVHPMMTEAVGYISGRSELLCATFFLLALRTARRWMLGGRGLWLLLTFGLWILALASKETAVMFPFVVFCYSQLVLRGTGPERRRRLLRLQVPLFVFGVLIAAVRLTVFVLIEHRGEVDPDWGFVLLELDVIRRYLALIVLPGGQTIFHELVPVGGLTDPRALFAIGVVGGLAGLAWWIRRVEGLVSFGVFWFLLALLPSSALVVLGRGEPMAEHRVYLASCGLFLAVAATIGRLEIRFDWSTRRRAKGILRATVVAGLVVLCAHTILRNAIWANPVTLWMEATDKAPDSWHAQLLLGEALHDAGRHDEAVGAFTNVLRLRPEEPAVYAKLGVCLLEVGQYAAAAAAFEKLRAINPKSPEASNGLGALALVAGQPDRARSHYEETLLYDPWNVPARVGLMKVEEIMGNPAGALRRCEEIRSIAPETPGNDECISRNRARAGGSGPARR